MWQKDVYAYDIDPGTVGLGSFPDLNTLVNALLPAILSIAGLLLFAFLIFGGIRYLTSGGDEKAVGAAKKIITNALLGMLIVFVAFWLIRIMETILGLRITGQ